MPTLPNHPAIKTYHN